MTIAYTVRESSRARRVRLTVSARDGVVVVVPRRYPRSRIPPLVDSKREWIERATERVREQRESFLAQRGVLPERVELQGIGESWAVEYVPTGSVRIRVTPADGTVRLSGAVTDTAETHRALRRFGRGRAEAALPGMLRALSREQELPFSAVRIRSQRTRWGSCSASGDINLNWTLAFLPPELVRHVMLHELVHTVRLDHSPHFRSLLTRREPDARRMAADLGRGWHHVPAWAVDG